MKREDVEHLARTCSETGHNHVMSIEVPRVLRYLIDRAQRVEAELARCRSIDALQRASERMKQLEIERDEAAGAAASAEAERDAAFAAGQESMREQAGDAVLYLCRMKGMGERTIDGPEAAHLIRALPLKDRSA